MDEIAEKKIREAIENKVLEGLEGMGRPVDNKEYFSASEDKRMAMHIMKNANVQPEEIELKKEIIKLNSRMREELTDEEKKNLLDKRSELLTQLDLLLENYRNK